MAHLTEFGRNRLGNPAFTGRLGTHRIESGVFQPSGSAFVPTTTTANILHTDLFGNPDCAPGQIHVPVLGCINIPNPFEDPTDPCGFGFVSDGMGGCVPTDPTGPPDSPAERGAVADGPALPSRVARDVHVCPKFVDGSTGILYFSPITGQIICLPRSMTSKSAMAFGLIRKNKPRAKAPVTAADQKLLSKIASIQGKIGTLAAKADGLSCPPKKKR